MGQKGIEMANFTIQKRSEPHGIWYTPGTYSNERKAGSLQSDSVEELRGTIRAIADADWHSWWQHYRIITDQGSPVERYKVRAGAAKKTRTRY